MEEGTFNPQGENDELTIALGNPEHSGRLRAVGTLVPKTAYYGDEARRRPRDVVSRAEHDLVMVSLLLQSS